jgi:hypothetical protein
MSFQYMLFIIKVLQYLKSKRMLIFYCFRKKSHSIIYLFVNYYAVDYDENQIFNRDFSKL